MSWLVLQDVSLEHCCVSLLYSFLFCFYMKHCRSTSGLVSSPFYMKPYANFDLTFLIISVETPELFTDAQSCIYFQCLLFSDITKIQ